VKFSKGVLEMKKSALAMALLAMCFAAACAKKKAEPPAPPAPTAPPPAPAPTEAPAPVEDEYSKLKKMSVDEIDRLKLLADVHFDFDKADIRDADKAALGKNADVLKKFDFLKIAVEGHCDERGSVEYNLALGERRAKAAMDYLVGLGVPADRLRTVSYGKEVPLCSEHTEDCWARNRRAHFTVAEKIKK
jgi:peptidoglycan-associated lipoprotein